MNLLLFQFHNVLTKGKKMESATMKFMELGFLLTIIYFWYQKTVEKKYFYTAARCAWFGTTVGALVAGECFRLQ